jgi:hypothetical protein
VSMEEHTSARTAANSVTNVKWWKPRLGAPPDAKSGGIAAGSATRARPPSGGEGGRRCCVAQGALWPAF